MEKLFRPIQSCSGVPLHGIIKIPGDKSLSHRALIFSALATGTSKIAGLLVADDIIATVNALRALGTCVQQEATNIWKVNGRGLGGLFEPEDALNFRNSGTGARLMMGILATHDLSASLIGDKSLSNRPMQRVVTPLLMMGADIFHGTKCQLPLTIKGTSNPLPIDYELPVASAQVKSAIILAALNTPGISSIFEPYPSRDHTENLLRHFGGHIDIKHCPGEGRYIRIKGQPELQATHINIPGDVSSAAFPIVAATIVPGSKIEIQSVGINPLRVGLINVLKRMGASIHISNKREEAGELVADIKVESTSLKGVNVLPEEVPAMIDEFPILSVAAAFADGKTTMTGLAELRVKESDRLFSIGNALEKCGVEVEIGSDWIVINGKTKSQERPEGGGIISVDFDHRIAMAFLIMGLATKKPVTIDDGSSISTSFPTFYSIMRVLGADFVEGE